MLKSKIYLSNDVYKLAEKLNTDINNDLTKNPFIKPLILVHNQAQKQWLSFFFAKENEITLNLHFEFLEKGLKDIRKKLDDNFLLIPDQDEIRFILFGLLKSNLEDQDLLIFKNFLQESSSFSEKTTWDLACKLAKYFEEYEYHCPDLIESWKENKLFLNENSQIERAEKKLYLLCLKKLKQNYPVRWLFTEDFSSFNENQKRLSQKVYVFGFSQLAKTQINNLKKLSEFADLKIYHLYYQKLRSPTQNHTWQKLDAILPFKSNSLYTNWSKAAEISLSNLSDTFSENDFLYLHESISENQTFLNTIKEQIFNEEKQSLKQDKSFQIFKAPGIKKEAETVYLSILENLKNTPGLKADDIAVIVPNADDYYPFLQSFLQLDSVVLQNGHFKNLLAANLNNSNLSKQSFYAKALLSLLSLPAQNFGRKALFELFFNPCFLEAFSLSYEEVSDWLEEIDKNNIFHNFSLNDPNSFSQGLKRMRFSKIMQSSNSNSFHSIVPSNNPSSSSKLYSIFTSLYESLHLLKSKKLSALNWKSSIEKLCETFLEIPKEFAQENFVKQFILKRMDFLEKEAQSFSDPKSPFSEIDLSTVKAMIENALNQKESFKGYLLCEGVNISNFLSFRSIPFKIVYTMGLNEGSFPSSEDYSSLNLRSENYNLEQNISLKDSDTYLFLETLLATKEKLYLSYNCKNLQKDQELFASSLINQLRFFFQEKGIRFEEIEIPLEESSKLNLKSPYSNLLQNINSKRLEFEELLQKPKTLLEEKVDTHETPDEVSIHQLKQFLEDPLKAFLNQKLKISTKTKTLLLQKESEDFNLNGLSRFKIKAAFCEKIMENPSLLTNLNFAKESLSNFLDFEEKKGSIPSFAYKNILLGKINKNLVELFSSLEKDQSIQRLLKSAVPVKLDFLNNTQSDFSFTLPDFLINEKKYQLQCPSIQFLFQKEQKTLLFALFEDEINKHILLPFLYYLFILISNEEKAPFFELKILLISNFLSSKKSTTAVYHYKISKDEAFIYLQKLLEDTLKLNKALFFPLNDVLKSKKQAENAAANVNDKKITEKLFCEFLENKEDSSLKWSNFDDLKNYQNLFDSNLPEDSYKKACFYLNPILGEEND